MNNATQNQEKISIFFFKLSVELCACMCMCVRVCMCVGKGGGGCIEYNLLGKRKTKAAVKIKMPPSPVCVLLPQCAMPAYHAADISPNNVSAYLGICQLCK